MFEWLFGRKNPKSLTKVFQETEVKGNGNRVVQTTNIVNQRGAKAKGDIVGGNMYRSYTRVNDTSMDILNPLNPLSPLNPMNQPPVDHPKHSHSHSHSDDSGSSSSSHSHSHSHDSGSSSSHSHSSSSSSSYDSGSSSSYDSGSSSSYDSSSY
jgi:uncharacterized membrane protein YgcG